MRPQISSSQQRALPAAELAECIRQAIIPNNNKLAICSGQRGIQLARPPNVLGKRSRLDHDDRVELKTTRPLGVVQPNLGTLAQPCESTTGRLAPTPPFKMFDKQGRADSDDRGRTVAVALREPSCALNCR